MIYELSKEKFQNVFGIVDPKWDNVEIKSVIAGNNPGWIFADSVENPKTALVWSRGIKGFYFIGDPENTEFNFYINQLIDNSIRDRAVNSGLDRFECSGDCMDWDDVLEKIFESRSLAKSQQCVYKLEKEQWSQYKRSAVNESFALSRVNRDLFNDANIRNPEFLTLEIMQWWDSLEVFFSHAFGYCVIHDNTIVSYSLTNFVYENIYTIGIETLQDYRRKGLSQASTEAFIANCIANGLNPYWDCMFTNAASRALVEKLRFHLDHIYSLYSFPLK